MKTILHALFAAAAVPVNPPPPITPPSSQALRFVSPHNGAPNNVIGAGTTGAGDRRRMLTRMKIVIGGGDVSQLVIAFMSWMLNNGSKPTSGFTIEAAYLERESVAETRQILFGGRATRMVAANATDVHCDPILPSSFSGAPATFPVGSVWYARVQILLANVTDTVPTSDFNASTWMCNPATTVLAPASATGNLQIVSGADASPTANLCMLALGRYVSGDPLVTLVIGNSIAAGMGDPFTGLPTGFHRAQFDADLVSHPRGGMMTALSGSNAWLLGTMTDAANLFLSFFKYANTLVDEYGTNGGTVQQSIDVWAAARAKGITKVVRTMLTPRTTGNFTTEAGQAYAAERAAVDAFNTQLTTTPGIDVLMHMNSVRGVDLDKWAPNMTSDGLHPNAAGAAMMAIDLRSVYSGVAPPPPPPPPPAAQPFNIVNPSAVGLNVNLPVFINRVQEGWDYFQDLSVGPPVALDANNWPLHDFCASPGLEYTHPVAVTYACRIGGYVDSVGFQETAFFSSSNLVYDTASNTSTFTITQQPGGVGVHVFFNGTRRTGGAAGVTNTGVTDFVMAAPGYTLSDITAKVIMDSTKAYLQCFQSLRLMDWMYGNGGSQTTLAEYNHTRRTAGLNLNHLMQMCNKALRGPYVTIAVTMPDAAIGDMFDFIEATLDPSLTCYVEYGNENWNIPLSPNCYRLTTDALIEVNGFSGMVDPRVPINRNIVTATRSANVVTMTTNIAHNYAAGMPLYLLAFDSMDGQSLHAPINLISASGVTMTFTLNGVDGAVGFNDNSMIYANPNSNLIDDGGGAWSLQKRVTVRRTKEIADILFSRPTLGASKVGVGKRYRCVLADQMSNGGDGDNRFEYVHRIFPGAPVNTWIHAHAGAPYFNDINTLNNAASTPQEVGDSFLAGAAIARNSNSYAFETRMLVAAKYGMEPLWYEGGCDNGGSDWNGGAQYAEGFRARNYSRMLPVAKTFTAKILTDWFSMGGGMVHWYGPGFIPTATVSNPTAKYIWGLTDVMTNLNSPSMQAIAELKTTGTQITRNVLSNVIGTAITVGGQNRENQYNPAVVPWAAICPRFLVFAPTAGVYSLSMQYSCAYDAHMSVVANLTTGGTVQTLIVNPGAYPDWSGTHDTPAQSLTLKAGANCIWFQRHLADGTLRSNGGDDVIWKALTFTKVS